MRSYSATIGCFTFMFILGSGNAAAAPLFSKGTAVAGVIAYQDDTDKNQFHYQPGRIDLALGVNLKAFKAQYWGIGPTHWAQDSSGAIYSIVGAIVSGSANIDITAKQRTELTAEIKKAYGVANPKLLPLSLKNVTVTPVLDSETLSLGKKDVTVVFPSIINFTSDFAYSIGTGNSLFAQVVGARQSSNFDIQPNPTFAVNFVGETEFVGDPWTAKISCDLSQVWSQIRSKFSASASLGWFKVGSLNYSKVQQELEKSKACTFDMKEGSLDNEKYGRQVFDMVKKIYEAVNKLAVEGDGFFRFEPNPDAGDPGGGGASATWPWSVSVNAGYSSAHFKQTIEYKDTVSYTGRFNYRIPASMVLAVSCNSATKSMFSDLSNASEACITQQKIDTFNARMACEAKAKQPKLLKLEEKLALGEINTAQYDRLLALYNRTSFCETFSPAAAEMGKVLPAFSGERFARIQSLTDAELNRLEAEALGIRK
ncbi:hypothetical protein [Inhella proteolytica]|uniref:YARHG domain-containing protein n=1 Tax=Inhella proteolytica TaxID=2795029 RepID=A0A931J2H7_9BURK|nr:hypothetical protein [Inhella proteolytica]MBH9576955.1 hypothetical protein [Inhella proteolytica]